MTALPPLYSVKLVAVVPVVLLTSILSESEFSDAVRL